MNQSNVLHVLVQGTCEMFFFAIISDKLMNPNGKLEFLLKLQTKLNRFQLINPFEAQNLVKKLKLSKNMKLTSFREDCKRKMEGRLSKPTDDITPHTQWLYEIFEIFSCCQRKLGGCL